MESGRKELKTARKEYDLPTELEAKESTVLRNTKRQLMKDKAHNMLTPKNSSGAEVSGTSCLGEVDGDDYEISAKTTSKTVATKVDSDACDDTFANISTLKAPAKNFAIEATDTASGNEDTDNKSDLAQKYNDTDLEGSPKFSGKVEDAKDSEIPAALPEGMFIIEAIKGSRMLINGEPQFLIEWKDYPSRRDFTWEPEKTLIDAVPEILSEYYDKIGGRDRVGKKRKRSRPSNVFNHKSNLVQDTKKQKVDHEQATEMDKTDSDEGKELGLGVPKMDRSAMGAVEVKKPNPNPKIPSPKKRRGRPVKSRAVDTAVQDNVIPNKFTGTVDNTVEDSNGYKDAPSTGSTRKATSEIGLNTKSVPDFEQAEKIKVKEEMKSRVKVKPAAEGFAGIEDSGQNIPGHSDDDIPNRRPGGPLKFHNQLSPTAEDEKSGRNMEENIGRRKFKGASGKSPAFKVNPFAKGNTKKAAGRTIKNKESAAGRLGPGPAGTVMESSVNHPAKSVGGAGLSTGMQRLREIPSVREATHPAKAKGLCGMVIDSSDTDEENEPEALE